MVVIAVGLRLNFFLEISKQSNYKFITDSNLFCRKLLELNSEGKINEELKVKAKTLCSGGQNAPFFEIISCRSHIQNLPMEECYQRTEPVERHLMALAASCFIQIGAWGYLRWLSASTVSEARRVPFICFKENTVTTVALNDSDGITVPSSSHGKPKTATKPFRFQVIWGRSSSRD